MLIMSVLDLEYEVYAVGKTEKECKANLLKGFQEYLKGYQMTLEEFLENARINFEDYNNDIWTVLEEYFGVRTYDITKGYTLGWE